MNRWRILLGALLLLIFFVVSGSSEQRACAYTLTDAGDDPFHAAAHPSIAKPGSPGSTSTGEASWYGRGLAGHKTASGETFDPNKMTAASTQLPLGSHAMVTNPANGRSVKVKVNDCGPQVRGRKLDLSKKAAKRLGMIQKGTATVKVKVVDAPAGARHCDDLKSAKRAAH